MVRLVLLSVVILVGLAGTACRNGQPEPTHNENLGTSEAPLLPTSGPLLDRTLLQGGRGSAMNLPQKSEPPTLAELESRSVERAVEEPPEPEAPSPTEDEADAESDE